MKVALVCPSNMLYMPYVNNYIKILDDLDIDYTIINWDRFSSENNEYGFVYRDKKIGHQRNYYDYFKYKVFVLNKLREIKFDKVIVFTLQLGYFFKRYLIDNYKDKYIFDIRDYNKIFKFSNFKTLIDLSYLTVISSPGYKTWLPNSNKYIVNHNTSVTSLKELRPIREIVVGESINISTIGVIRHWDVNIDFVSKLKNKKNFNLVFHGEGTINEKLENYIKEHNINNVQVYGRYRKEDEGKLYGNTDLINILLYDDINSNGVLANRLYNSAIYGKPVLSLKGTYLSKQIEKYKLGLVLNSLDDIGNSIKKYLDKFDKKSYENGRKNFFESVIRENNEFKIQIEEFVLK